LKLAFKLVEHHRRSLDFIRALELAEKGVERVQAVKSVSETEKASLSFDPDYSQNCVGSGVCDCSVGTDCEDAADCYHSTSCACGCPGPSKPNSHYVSNTCEIHMSGCMCVIHFWVCSGVACVCGCMGLCYYSCDAGYVWNPVTSTCDAVAGGGLLLRLRMKVGL
jgi:hypothetical protein